MLAWERERVDEHPLVSVGTPTCNHEQVIGQCPKGILMQRTTFPFEVIVGEVWSLAPEAR